MAKIKEAKRITVTVQGPNLSRLNCWESFRNQMEKQVYELFRSRNLRLDQIIIVVQDADIFSDSGNALVNVEQSNDTKYFPDEVERIIRTTLRQLPKPIDLID